MQIIFMIFVFIPFTDVYVEYSRMRAQQFIFVFEHLMLIAQEWKFCYQKLWVMGMSSSLAKCKLNQPSSVGNHVSIYIDKLYTQLNMHTCNYIGFF